MCGPCWALVNLLMDMGKSAEKMSLSLAQWHSWLEGRVVMPGTFLSPLGLGGERPSESEESRAKQIPKMEKDKHFWSPGFTRA